MNAKTETAARAGSVRHMSALVSWEMTRRAPAPPLRPYVSLYEGYVDETADLKRRMQIPSAIIPMIINFGSEYTISGPGSAGGPATHDSFVAGMVDAHVIVESTGLNHGMQVNFTPIGARLFLGMPMSELTNRTVRMDDVLGGAGRRLAAQLEDTPEWDARFDILDAFISDRIALAQAPTGEVAWAWRRLSETGGTLNIGTLAEEIGWSRKHLIARFREHIGLPPKTAARVLRFSSAVRQIENAEPVHWTEIAYACGYYDQAHFNRDFREFTGGTPSEFLARRLPDGAGLLG